MEENVRFQQIVKDLREKEGELEELNRTLNVRELKSNDELQAAREELREKEAEIEYFETLIVMECKRNNELQDAREEIIDGLKMLPRSSCAHIGVKRMGDIDDGPFLEAMKRKYNDEEAEVRASELCSLWTQFLKDPHWHPFKRVKVDRNEQEVINDKDDRLENLKAELGNDVYKAVTNALVEINEYDPS